MREIKFRVWVQEIDKMYYPQDLHSQISLSFIGKIRNYNLLIADEFDNSKSILMKFTGLKDKNGKEIYEGDIFESPSGILFYVLWYKDGWCYNNVDDSPNHISGRLSKIAEYWKVIGNIYENPNLIKNDNPKTNLPKV